MATLHPFSRQHELLRNHCNLILWLAWIIGSLYSYGWVEHSGTEDFIYEGVVYYKCKHGIGLDELTEQMYLLFNYIFTFAVPLVILTITYGSLSKKLYQDTFAKNDAPLRRNAQFSDRAKVNINGAHFLFGQLSYLFFC